MIFKFHNKKVHYKTEGSGEAVVLLHGFLENLGMWNEITEELTKTHQVIRLDLPGFGKSDCIQEFHSMKLFAECTHQLLQKLSIDTFTVLGHSMGGYAALELSKICPEKINHLILYHSRANADSAQKKKDRGRAIKAVNDKQSIYLKTAIPFLFPKQLQQSCATHIQNMIVEAEALNPIGISAALKGMQKREDNNETLKNLSCKKTYFAGALDPILKIDDLRLEAKHNDANFVEIKNSGHMSHWENAKMALEEILKLLSNIQIVSFCKNTPFTSLPKITKNLPST
jgi:pimeloyl-ACP methyl ester carboxylesterase